jgi:hypothetical protein
MFRDADGCLVGELTFRYSDEGNLIEETYRQFGQELLQELLIPVEPVTSKTICRLSTTSAEPRIRRHRYDELGRRIESVTDFGPLGMDRKIIGYNEHGDQNLEILYFERSEYDVNDKGHPGPVRKKINESQARFHYQYDACGNWIEKIVESRTGHKDFVVSSIERRILTYFDKGFRSPEVAPGLYCD